MRKKIIIISGYAAAGKTSFALRLSQALNVPCFCKDLLKNALSSSLPVNNRDDSKRLSAATFDALAFVAERFMETGHPLIIEANFVMHENHHQVREGDVLKSLIEKYDYQPLTYLFLGDLHVLYKRFIEREQRPERGQANRLWGELSCEDFIKSIKPLGDFNIGGELIKIDTTDFNAVNFAKYFEIARLFI